MGYSVTPRIHKDLADCLDSLAEKLSAQNGKQVSKVEVSRFVAGIVMSIDLDEYIGHFERAKPNGNRYKIRVIAKMDEYPKSKLGL